MFGRGKMLPVEMTVRPLQYERMSGGWKRYFQELSGYEAPFLEEKLLLEGAFPADGSYQEAFVEFKKFIGLAKLYGKSLDMPSRTIDAVWHQFILFTRDYHAFCGRFYGRYFHHTPALPSMPLKPGGMERLVRLYAQTFGDMPPVWKR